MRRKARARSDNGRERATMRVVQVSSVSPTGGAGRAALRQHLALRNAGCESFLAIPRTFARELPDGLADDPATVLIDAASPIERMHAQKASFEHERLMAPYRKTIQPRTPFNLDSGSLGMAAVLQIPDVDVVNLHWTAGLTDFDLFFASNMLNKPVVWTLHDMQPFTGGCHYARDCTRYRESCGACPILGSDREDDPTRLSLTRKCDALAAYPHPVHVVAPSRWLADAARESALFRDRPVHHVPYCIDPDLFRPFDRAKARSLLGLPPDGTFVAFVAYNTNGPRKGLAALSRAVARVAQEHPGLMLLIVGKEMPLIARAPLFYMGPVSDDRLLAQVYAAADVVGIPSLEDNLPLVLLEASAAGRPMLGTRIGGIPDLCRPGETGELADADDVAGMAEGLRRLLADRDALDAMGQASRVMAETDLAPAVLAQRMMAVYDAMTGPATAA